MPDNVRRSVVVTGAVAAGAAAVAAGVALAVVPRHQPSSRPLVSRYLAAWSAGDTTTMASLLDAPPPDLATVATSLIASAPGSHASFTLTRATAGSATYHADVSLAGFGTLAWDDVLTVVKGRVRWAESDLYPGLVGAQRLDLERVWPARAAILADDGAPLVSQQPAVSVGLEPDRITSLASVQATLSRVLGVEPALVAKDLAAPGVRPNYFVPVVTVPVPVYTALRPQLAPVPGVFFRHVEAREPAAGPSQLLGAVGEITAERLAQLGPPYRAGDQVGLSGLEAEYEARLAGRPSGDVDVVDAGHVVRVVAHFDGVAPQPVRVTLDLAIQRAATAALSGSAAPAALVAVDASTGDVRAVVSTPASQGFDRALDGLYPPGSTFKVVTTAALLASGRTPATPASCPPRVTVDGRTFSNFEGEAPGGITLSRAFAISCNTAFIGLATGLPAGAEATAAGWFGFNTRPTLGAGGNYPPPADAAEAAAAAIGQGRVTASPLQMATVAAAVDAGQWHAPRLLVGPATAAPPGAQPAPLDPSVAANLRALMRLVVTSGTGTAANVRGETVFGKTGTAEFGSGTPPKTHAWFIGYRGGLAFAVIVEGGGVGGAVAAPLAAKFVTAAP
jgi:cell division protein FtsI/penicillin-binding protein 2